MGEVGLLKTGHRQLTDIVVGVTFWLVVVPEYGVRPPLRRYVQKECVELFKNRDRVSVTGLGFAEGYASGLTEV